MRDTSDLRAILAEHYKRYPLIQIQDLFKLVYQNEFAGGHLITDEVESLQRLKNELQSLPAAAKGHSRNPLERFESIGNGLLRLNLAQIEETGLDLSTVNRIFIKTAEAVAGTRQGFQSKLEILRACLQDGSLPLDPTGLDEIMQSYDFDHCPPVSHSAIYRQAYAPSYRIVQAAYGHSIEAFRRIDLLLQKSEPVRVAIDGPCGSGKSTLAALLEQIYQCNVIPMDHFFLPPQLRTPARLHEPGGNIDYERFVAEVVAGLCTHQAFQYRAYDCQAMDWGQTVMIPQNRLTLVEGSYSMHPKYGELYDLKIFLQIDRDEQLRRILRRSGPAQLQRFIREWIPMENQYFSEYQIAEHSDLIIS